MANAERPGERSENGAAAARLRAKLWLERDGRVALSDWRVELLEAIDETGSLARAAAKLRVPYKTAWYKLREIQQRSGIRMLETRSGGAAGGGSRLTPAGRDLVERFHRVAEGIAELANQRFQSEFGDLFG